MAGTWAEWQYYCILQLPWSPVDIRDVCGRQIEDGVLLGEDPSKSHKWNTLGRLGEITASAIIRGHPRAPAMCGRKMVNGELLGKRQTQTP